MVWALVALAVQLCGLSSADTGVPILKYEEPRHLVGTIYSADRKKPLFKFTRSCVRNGDILTVSRDCTDLVGRPVLKEVVIYHGDVLAQYDITDLQLGSRGSAKILQPEGGRGRAVISYEYLKEVRSPKKAKTATEPYRSNCLIGDMVAPFLMDHWDDVMKGSEVKCRYIVVDRRETVGFTFVKDSESRRRDRNVIIVKMFPTSRIISALVDPIFFTIEKEGQRRILEYSGRTPVAIKEGSKWKDLDGVTVFEWEK